MTRSAALLTLSIALSIAVCLLWILGTAFQLPAFIGGILVSYFWPVTLLSRQRDRERKRATATAAPPDDL